MKKLGKKEEIIENSFLKISGLFLGVGGGGVFFKKEFLKRGVNTSFVVFRFPEYKNRKHELRTVQNGKNKF